MNFIREGCGKIIIIVKELHKEFFFNFKLTQLIKYNIVNK
jgi:hypothetical protein